MKKITSAIALFFFLQVNAQTITGISIFPSNPTTDDNVLILGQCMFTSGSCDQHTQGHFVAGNNISTWALHCLGMLTVICTDTDTFAVGMLPAGTYTVNYQLDEGHGGPPCTPGIAPGPNVNTSFTVSTPTAVSEADLNNNSIIVYPNPVSDQMIIENRKLTIKSIEIYDMLGSKIFTQNTEFKNKHQVIIDVSALRPGVYFVKVKNETSERMARVLKR